jgi:hypothetical protein
MLDERGPEPDCSARCDWTDGWHGDLPFDLAYGWLAEEVGFPPLFCSAGGTEEDIRITGYQGQWARVVSSSMYRDCTRRWRRRSSLRKAGEAPDLVLMGFRDLPGARFQDYGAWHVILNSSEPCRPADGPWAHRSLRMGAVGPRARASVLKPSRSSSDWLRDAQRRPGCVQAVVPELDLRAAASVWCRRQRTARLLAGMGFDPSIVHVVRLRIER